MELIQNSGNGSRLEVLNRSAVEGAENVVAAVAYVTDIRTLIDECWKHRKPLTLFARYDYSGPVAEEVLQWFLSRGPDSANYQMRLVADIFHPKVIWWQGVGAYIGSANLTKRAWGGNVEAGVYFSEEDLDEHGLRAGLVDFFNEVARLSHPLTKEVADEMVKFRSGDLAVAQGKVEASFEKSRRISRQPSLISITKRSAGTRARAAFLKEWSETLQILRDIGQRIARPENLPVWISPDASPGVLADQFLHAYYYNKVRDAQNYPYRDLFEVNKNDREAALQSAIDWWRKLPAAPSDEDIHIRDWAPAAKNLLSRQAVADLSASQFQDLCSRVHAVRDHAKRVSSTTLGLQQGMHKLKRDDRIQKFAAWLYGQRSPDQSTPCEVIDFVLYGGPKTEVPDRLFAACFEDQKKVAHMGVSTLGEMVGWAMPDDFPPRNGRTSKALTALGYNVTIHSE